LANPSPGSIIAKSTGRVLIHLPWIPIGVTAAVIAGAMEVRRRRSRRPATWAHRASADLERAGARSGVTRGTGETLTAYCGRLADADPDSRGELITTAAMIEAFAYGGIEPSAEQIALVGSFARHFRGGRPHPIDTQARDSPRASSNEAPASSSGR
jgi:hypothetical protein